MPDVYTGRQFTVTNDRVEIPDWEQPQVVYTNLPLVDFSDDLATQEEAEQASESQDVSKHDAQTPPSPPPPPPEPLTKEQLKELFSEEWQAVCEEEKEKAYLQTKQEYSQKFEQCLTQMDRYLSDMEQNQQAFFQRYAQELKQLAIDIAEKWLNQRLQDDGLLLEKLVLQSMDSVKDAKWMDVQLSSDLVQLTEKMRQIIEASGQSEVCKIKLKKAPLGTCVVKTDKGELDASIQIQAKVLRKAFSRMEQDQEGADNA